MRCFIVLLTVVIASFRIIRSQERRDQQVKVPADIAAVLNKPLYQGAVWGSASSIGIAEKS